VGSFTAVPMTDSTTVDVYNAARDSGDQFWINQQTVQQFQWNGPGYKYALIPHVIHLLWTMEFNVYFTYTVVAGAIANWYFSRRDATGLRVRGTGSDELPHAPVWESVKRTVVFHIGTVAFASLVIGITTAFRDFLRWMELKIAVKEGKEANRCQRCCMSMMVCCLDCADCCLDKISQNGLVWTSIWGDGFLTACCSSFELMWHNLGKVAAFTYTQGFLIVIGKVMVALATTGLMGIIIINVYKNEISSVIMPNFALLTMSYMIATLFMNVFQSAIDVIFFCYLVDSSAFEEQPDRMYASKALHELFMRNRPTSEVRAQKIMAAQDARVAARTQTMGQSGAAQPVGSAAATPQSVPAASAAASPAAAPAAAAGGYSNTV